MNVEWEKERERRRKEKTDKAEWSLVIRFQVELVNPVTRHTIAQ